MSRDSATLPAMRGLDTRENPRPSTFVGGSIVEMRIGVAAVLVVACAWRQAEPTKSPHGPASVPAASRKPSKHAEARVEAPRPDVDVSHLLPDFQDDLRWPLTAMGHPSMEPRFAVASVFAAPGVSWLDLCERGVQKRSTGGRNLDELEYLRAWCSAAAGDIDAACATLTTLTTSSVLGLPSAVRLDLANLIASTGGRDKAEHLLSANKLNDPQLLDTLAATYIELGAERDADEMNRLAMETNTRATRETQCRRLIKHIVLSDVGEREASVQALKALATTPRYPDPTCQSIYHAWMCVEDARTGCWQHLDDLGAEYRWNDVLRVYRAWPAGPAPMTTWLRFADELRFAVKVPASLPLLIGALDAASRVVTPCAPEVHDKIVEIMRTMGYQSVTVPDQLVALEQACK